MVFTLVQSAKDTIEALQDKRLKEAENRKKQKEVEEAEKAKKTIELSEEKRIKIIGAPVTVEAFTKWKQKFDEEVRIKREKEREKEKGSKASIISSDNSERLSGKQMWERQLVQEVEEEDLPEDFVISSSSAARIGRDDDEEEEEEEEGDETKGSKVEIDESLFTEELEGDLDIEED
eukprot:TRINITY_DN425_c1_g1_i2.p1 TRINITY_DN425_c1_g1~~TRINITY_DN425_c1_g1_i2.p1  ORF type:complete len:177 (-),score=76.49 TRINITY_DN425_c1_g1_i2:39-569(-)